MITQENLLKLIKETNEYKASCYLTINGEYYNTNNFRAIANAFKSGYNETITLKINGIIVIENGVLL